MVRAFPLMLPSFSPLTLSLFPLTVHAYNNRNARTIADHSDTRGGRPPIGGWPRRKASRAIATARTAATAEIASSISLEESTPRSVG
jgi:hypothetical protein